MKIINIKSKKHGNHEVLVDYSDYEMLSKYTWFLARVQTKSGGYINYAAAHQPDNSYKISRWNYVYP
jgi:hypothetical protein